MPIKSNQRDLSRPKQQPGGVKTEQDVAGLENAVPTEELEPRHSNSKRDGIATCKDSSVIRW